VMSAIERCRKLEAIEAILPPHLENGQHAVSVQPAAQDLWPSCSFADVRDADAARKVGREREQGGECGEPSGNKSVAPAGHKVSPRAEGRS
jgi:hypothetical protein